MFPAGPHQIIGSTDFIVKSEVIILCFNELVRSGTYNWSLSSVSMIYLI